MPDKPAIKLDHLAQTSNPDKPDLISENDSSYGAFPSNIQKRFGLQILLFMFAELMLINLMIHTIANDCAAPPASSGNFFMWSLGGISFELALIPLILMGFAIDLNQRLLLATGLAAAFGVSVILGLDSGLGEEPIRIFWTLLCLAPVGCVIAGIPIGLVSFFTTYKLRLKSELDSQTSANISQTSIKTIMVITAAFAFALVALQQTLQGLVTNRSGFELSGITDYLTVNLIMLIFVSTVSVWIMFGQTKGTNFHQHVLLGLFGSIGFGWLAILMVGGFLKLDFNLVVVGFYFTISAISALLHFYLFAFAIRLMGFELSGSRTPNPALDQ